MRRIVLLLLAGVRSALACTALGVGRDASDDGSVMVAHSDDSGGMGDPRLVHVPARDWPNGTMRPVYLSISDYPRVIAPERAPEYAPANEMEASLPWVEPIGYIPQVAHTYAYWDTDYGLGNEHQLVMAETSCAGRISSIPLGQPNGTALFGIEELGKIALERCRTAVCAVTTMGELAEQHGYYGGNGHLGVMEPWPGTKPGEEGEALVIGDALGELWVFHILPGANGRGAVWAAQRMDDDKVTVVANMFIIRQMNLTDAGRFRASRDIEGVAHALGFWEPADGPFDFTAAFAGNVKAADERHELINQFYSGRRIWRVYDVLAPSMRLDPDLGCLQETPTYPIAITPEAKVSVGTVFRLYRDFYEGTPFDLSKGLAAGPYGTPNRFGGGHGEVEAPGGWERAISMYRTLFSFVAQARPSLPDEVGGVVWFGEDSPHATCYFPFFLAQGRLPRAYTHGTQGEYSAGSAWWTFNLIKRFIDLNFRAMIEDVRAAQEECEAGGRKVLAEAEAAALAALRAPSPSSSKRGATSSGAAKPHSPGRLLKATAKPKATSAPPPTPSAPPASPAGATAAAARAIALLENATCTHAEYVQSAWQSLFADLMVRYKNGYTNTIVAQGIVREKTIGYPAWWLRLVGYTGWMDFVKSRGAEHAQQRAESGDLEADSSKEPDMSVWAAGDDTAARKAASTQPAWARAAGAHPAIFTCIALLCGAVLFGLGVLAGPHLAKPRALCGAGSWPQASAEAPLLPAKADREMVPGRNA